MVFLSRASYSVSFRGSKLYPSFFDFMRSKLKDVSFCKVLNENAAKRGEKVDLTRLSALLSEAIPTSETDYEALSYLSKIPNWTHPAVPIGDESASVTIKTYCHPSSADKRTPSVTAEKLSLANNWMRISDTGLVFGPKTYMLSGPLCKLETALIQYALNKVQAKGFQLLHVPEIVNSSIINGCGFPTDSFRSQVYKLKAGLKSSGEPDKLISGDQLCLIGTAEMSLAGLLAGRCLSEKKLPLKLCALSRCFRAEASDNLFDKGLYRVHQFHKVELFVVGKNDLKQSNALHDELVSIEEELCQELDISYRILDIASKDLGLPAFRKFDIEAWLPGRKHFGELTSASNCTDWQSSRLGITYKSGDGSAHYAHTLNGTALAVPRVLIAILETHRRNRTVKLPKVLHPYYGSSEMVPLPRCWRSSPAQNVAGLLDAP